jgi:hypothetical protein
MIAALQPKTVAGEIGAAFAVLTIYVLTLLIPLHQAGGLQRDLARIGFGTVVQSICTFHAQDDDGDDLPVEVKCPAGIAKNEFTAIEPASLDIGIVRIPELVRYAVEGRFVSLSVHDHIGQARAPPVTV